MRRIVDCSDAAPGRKRRPQMLHFWLRTASIKKALTCLLLAAALCAPALAEPLGTEYLVNMTADEISAMEDRLVELGYLASESDGVFDAETQSALESFQQANGLAVTGAADEETLARLNSADALSRQGYLTRFANAYAQMTPLEKGSTSNDVLSVQRKLKEYGYFDGEPDGVFDDLTGAAVERFQMVNGLPVNGVADGAVLMRLMADSPITWPAFLTEMAAASGDSGLNVYVLQKRLSALGYFSGSCTAAFGELTEAAVLNYQRDRGLEATGSADADTWAALYAEAGAADGTLRVGDYGDDIHRIQERLNALGFFDHEITGVYGYTTETAVRLYQMAANLTATGEIDAATLAHLNGSSAISTLDGIVQQRFQLMLDGAGAQAQGHIARIAEGLLGAGFGGGDDELYPGFAFVQYVCVSAGLPVTFPEDLIRMADRQVETIEAVEAGDIVAFQSASADAVTIQLAIGAGDGKVYCTTESGGWVVLSYMDQMEGATIYCWDAE